MIDARGVADCASLGDMLAERIKQRGGAGVVTDGGVRTRRLWLKPVFQFSPPVRSARIAGGAYAHRSRSAIGCGGVVVIPAMFLLATVMALWLFQKILWTKSRGTPSIKKILKPLSSGRSKTGAPQ